MLAQLLLCLAVLPQSSTPPSAKETPSPALDRVILIGASVTDGFGLSLELEASASLATFLEQAMIAPHGEVKELGSTQLFMDPIGLGQAQVEKALAESPTLLLGIDFPFWFGYGVLRDPESRLKLLDRGLKMLERFECPMIVGDFPDMRAATKVEVPYLGGQSMLQPSQVPSPEELVLLNQRLREWVDSRENVHLFEMSRFARELHTERELEIRGNTIDRKTKDAMLQIDQLHPTAKGTALLTVLVFDALAREGIIDEAAIEWNIEKLERAVWKSTEAAREKRRERDRKREERKKAREAKKQGDGGGEKEECAAA